NTPLPLGFREALPQRLQQTQALVRGHQADAPQPPGLQVPQEGPPTGRVLLATLPHAQQFPVAVGVDAHRHQDRHVADLAAPGPLQPDAVEEDVGVLPLDGAVAPGLDAAVDLLVQLADRARTDPCTPQRLRNVLDTADRDARQGQLDQGPPRAPTAAAICAEDLR